MLNDHQQIVLQYLIDNGFKPGGEPKNLIVKDMLQTIKFPEVRETTTKRWVNPTEQVVRVKRKTHYVRPDGPTVRRALRDLADLGLIEKEVQGRGPTSVHKIKIKQNTDGTATRRVHST